MAKENSASRQSDEGEVIIPGTDAPNGRRQSDEEEVVIRGTDAPDGGYGWVICAAAAYVTLVGVGSLMCYGVLYIEFLDYFGEGRTKTSWIGALCFFSLGFAGPISSYVANRHSHRICVMVGGALASICCVVSAFATSIYFLFISFGLIGGLGIGSCWIQSYAILAMYFDKRRSLAFALVTNAGGVAYLVFPMMMEACIQMLTWRGTMIVVACLWTHTCIGGALLIPLVEKKEDRLLGEGEKHPEEEEEGGKKQSGCDVVILRMWQFWVYILLEYLMRTDYMAFPIILPDFAILNGHERARSALLLTIFGAVSIPARLIGGVIADRPKVNVILFLSLCIATLGLLSLVIPFTGTSYAGMGVVTALKGAVSGTLEVLQPAVVVLLFGRKRVTSALSYDMVAVNAGQLTAAPLAGAIYDQTGKYLFAYVTCSCFSIVAAALAFVLFLNNQQICVTKETAVRRKLNGEETSRM